MTPETWIERVTSLNQWRRGGERAPHKSLLLLYVLGRLQRTGSASVSFADAEPDLSRLLEEFGPPRKTNPGHPFHHLTNDGLWVVRTPAGEGSPGPNLGPLRAGAVGELAADFARDLEKDPRLLAAVVRAFLDANFPPTLHGDILDAVGIDLEPADLVEAGRPTRRRYPAFRGADRLRVPVCGQRLRPAAVQGGRGHRGGQPILAAHYGYQIAGL